MLGRSSSCARLVFLWELHLGSRALGIIELVCLQVLIFVGLAQGLKVHDCHFQFVGRRLASSNVMPVGKKARLFQRAS